VSLTREEVIRYLEGLSGEELGALADEILSRLGMVAIDVRPRVVIGAPPPDDHDYERMGMGLFDVRLLATGPDKIAVIRIVRRLLGPAVALPEAKKLVESAPVDLCVEVRRAEAEEITAELRRAGAEVEIR
jgi:large subunit ribosomal protein L7/L12